jgi:hypothetical protein
MRPLKDFENLTIKEIFVEILGEEVASKLLQEIHKGIAEGKSGEELKLLVHDELCKLNVTSFEIYELLHIVPQITETRHITR